MSLSPKTTQLRTSNHLWQFLCLLASLWVLRTEVTVGAEPDERYRGELEIRKQVLQGDPATSSAPYDLIRGTFVSDLIKESSLSDKSARPQIRISGVTVEGDLYLTDLDVWSKIRIETCLFKGSVFFTNTSFRKGLSCHGCTFEKAASFADVKVEGSADFEHTTFNRSVTFKDASIGGDLQMAASHFQDSANFWRLHVGSDLCLDNANFNDTAIFNHGSIGKFFSLSNTSFRGKAKACFDNLKVGEDALVKACFYGPVRWNYGEAKGIYYKGSQFFDSFSFDSNTVAHSVSFQNCYLIGHFTCRENKISDDLDARDAHFKSMNFKFTNRPAGNSEKFDDSERSFDADFFRTKAVGVARFNNASFDGSLSLERTDFQDFDITSIKPWPRQENTTQLAEATVKNFHAGPLEPEGWKTLLTFIDKAEYDEGLYIQMEQFLKARGDPEEADEVFISSQERAKKRLHSWPLIRSWIVDLVTAYGRQPWRTVICSVFVVVIGAGVFSDERDMQVRDNKFEGRKYNPLWYSFDLFAPVIDLEAASVWAPRPNKHLKWLYLRIHRLLGWVLVPIGIVAITGFLQSPAS